MRFPRFSTYKITLTSLVCCAVPLWAVARSVQGGVDKQEVFLQYLLPVWNIVLMLTINSKRKYKLTLLMLSIAFNIAGIYMLLYRGGIPYERTHDRALGAFVFFTFTELMLLLLWSRKKPVE